MLPRQQNRSGGFLQGGFERLFITGHFFLVLVLRLGNLFAGMLLMQVSDHPEIMRQYLTSSSIVIVKDNFRCRREHYA